MGGEICLSAYTSGGETEGDGLSPKDNTTAPDRLCFSIQNLPNELAVWGRGWLFPTIFWPLLAF